MAAFQQQIIPSKTVTDSQTQELSVGKELGFGIKENRKGVFQQYN